MRLALVLVLSTSAAASAQPAPTTPSDPEPAPGIEPPPGVEPPVSEPPPTTEPSSVPTPQQTSAGTPANRFGVDGAIVLPLSDYADEAKLGLGALARYELARSETFALTLRGGVLVHVPAEDRDTLVLVPAYAGVRFAFAPPWFLAADGGLTVSYQGDATAAIGVAFGGGYQRGKLSARVELLVPDLGAAESAAGIMASVGFSP